MKSKRYDGTDIRKILTGMVLDKTVCARISSQWQPEGLFAATWANLVGGLITRYFKKYERNPAGEMVSLFEEWSKETLASDEEIAAVELFLQRVSDEGHQDSTEYVLDLAGRHFNKVAMDRVIAGAMADLENWQVEDAQIRLSEFCQVNLGAGMFSAPFQDFGIWSSAFSNDEGRPLVSYREALGEFFGDAFQRGRLFSFMAPDKTGKTAWLIDFTYRAVRNNQNVAFFDSGDGREKEFLRRLGCRALGRPLRAGKYPIPDTWRDDGLIVCEKDLPAVTDVDAYAELQRLGCPPQALRATFHPSGTLSAADINRTLGDWDRQDDWRADIVVIDYSDLLAPPKGVKESLDQIDETWKTLRRISQQRHCLVVTATQASATAYGNEDGLLSKKHFSGRKTKLAHVNGMIGINVSSEEKDKGLSRINWIVRREGAYNEKHYIRVAGCMAVGNPAILSKR